MTSPQATAARDCPVCGARNSGLSLFCAECGSALNGSPDFGTSAYDATRATPDSQQTQAFIPASRDALATNHDRWQPPRETTIPSLAPPTQSTGSYPWTAGEQSAVQGHSPLGAGPTTVVFTSDRAGGIRGFVLGAVAMALIAFLLGLYLWAGVLGDATRETIGGWFDFVGGSGG